MRGSEDYRENLDEYARDYLHPKIDRSVDQKFLRMVVSKTICWLEGPAVLEMGYGDGAWTGQLIRKFGQSHVVDASLQLLETARTLYGDKVITYRSYFEEFKPQILFDSVVCTYVLEHVVDPVLVLSRSREWLKPNGLLLVAVPNAGSLHRRLGVVMGLQPDVHQLGDLDTSIGHRRVYDAYRMEADLAAAGFLIEKRAPMMFKPLPNSLLAYLSEAQLKGIFELGFDIPEDQRGILVYLCRTRS
jgi:2-polyprenyl-3-methyl-5-hydroxy-6-metoxy-1,4-benzoquinol methylase